MLLAAIVVLSGKAGGLGEATSVPWYYLIGGLLGAAYVFTALVLVDEIGAGGVAAATVTGQLTLSVVLDRLGVLGLEETPLSLERLVGVGLLLARDVPDRPLRSSRLTLDRRVGLGAEKRPRSAASASSPARAPRGSEVERRDDHVRDGPRFRSMLQVANARPSTVGGPASRDEPHRV